MAPEETMPLLIEPDGVVICPKSGALRIARDGFTMRPLEEPELLMKTLLVSRADNKSPALSELVRGFMRRDETCQNQQRTNVTSHSGLISRRESMPGPEAWLSCLPNVSGARLNEE